MAIEQREFDPYIDLSDLEFEGLMELEESLRELDEYRRREYQWETEPLALEVFHRHYARELARIQPIRQRFVLRHGNGDLVKMPHKHNTNEEWALKERRIAKANSSPADFLKAPIITPDDFELHDPYFYNPYFGEYENET